MESNSVCNHTRDNKIGRPRSRNGSRKTDRQIEIETIEIVIPCFQLASSLSSNTTFGHLIPFIFAAL